MRRPVSARGPAPPRGAGPGSARREIAECPAATAPLRIHEAMTRLLPRTLTAVLLLAAPAAAQMTPPPQPCVLTDVRLDAAPDAPRVAIVLEDGRIARILQEDAAPPPGLREVDGQGALALPAFVDAYTHAGCDTPEPVVDQDDAPSVRANVLPAMRDANRKGLEPSFRAVDVLDLDEKTLDGWREQGFGALHSCPEDELLSGLSAVATTRGAARRSVVVRPEVFATAAFRARGDGYPSTLMGYHAQLRQFFLDAAWYAERLGRVERGLPDRRPPYDRELEAVADVLTGKRRLLCYAQDRGDIDRWIGLADEFGLSIAIAGGAEAYEVADELARREIPVLLTLDWPDEVPDPDADEASEAEAEPKTDEAKTDDPDADAEEPEEAVEDEPAPTEGRRGGGRRGERGGKKKERSAADARWIYEEPLALRRERRRLWEERRDCAIRLHEAGVRFALGSGGQSPKELLKRARALVEAGLPEPVVARALTTDAAALLGLEGVLGRLAEGQTANVALWSAAPLVDEGASVRVLVVDGQVFELASAEDDEKGAPDEGVDASGTWQIEFESEAPGTATLVLEMAEDGAVTGDAEYRRGVDEPPAKGKVSGHVDGTSLKLSGEVSVEGFRVEVELTGELDGDALSGEASWTFSAGELTAPFRGTRTPNQEVER